MGLRHRAREAALQILYGMDVSGEDAERAIKRYWATLGAGEEPSDFANSLVRGCTAQREAIDDIIARTSQHWRVERMAKVDRNILRLGTYELKSVPDVPRNVTLDEAVELAKRYGDAESPAFVNGVLDHIARDIGKA
jgi:N utilization substance protein B